MRNLHNLFLLSLTIFCFFACSTQYQNYTVKSSGPSASSNDLAITGANLRISNNAPSLAFALNATDKDEWRFSYIMLIHHGHIQPLTFEEKSNVSMNNQSAIETSYIRLDDSVIEIDFKIDENVKTLTVNGERFEDGKPKLLLANTTYGGMNIKAVDLADNSTIHSLAATFYQNRHKAGPAWFEEFMSEIIKTLRSEHNDVDDYL